ncbi:exopolysaccharide biosynthesis polyprenyl glycosylphosphotransferase [uncultured Polaribacter sp.]|uniref:exopolysaccharide biosynthesis polyprenyl glycosylphosphotransferase n=1 Tax=uncultured Polaribacter sp. TaxID=174711 RepID=UPI0026383181|nr:exopolysaccharide biosynthesis polyprenyl glycosylphosphotransferase [uncultured Polaribacter sp.]
MNQKNYFNISERKIFLRIIDVIVLISSVLLSFEFLKFDYFDFKNEYIFSWLFLLIVYYLIFGEIFQLFNLNISNNRYLVTRSIVVTAFATVVFYVFTPFLSPILPTNRLQILYFFLIIVIPIIIWRFLYIQIIFSPKYFKTIIFIGKSEKIETMVRRVKSDNFHHLKAYFSDKSLENIEGFRNIHSEKLAEFFVDNTINEIVVSKEGLSQEVINSLNKELIYLFQKGLNIISFESFYEEITNRVPKNYLDHDFYKNINFSKNNTNRFYLFGLRVTDIMVSIIGILVFLILFPFILIGNLLANKGSLFYSQKRVGQNGEIFKIYKLRSMIKNAEKNGAVWAKKNDTRITAFGKFLRNTRLDEVPQFFNILKGEMSIIGPRPERPEFIKNLEDHIPFYAIRNVIRPGLTGWAQVNYPYATSIEEQEIKLRYDLYYIKERNAFLDFKILIKTITTVLFFRGQ